MAGSGARVFDGQNLRATLFAENAKTDVLLVRLQARDKEINGFRPSEPIRSFSDQGYPILALQSVANDWFVNSETQAFELALADIARRFGEVRIVGFSMGAYAAFRFANALMASTVVAVSPQYSIHPKIVPFEKRYVEEGLLFDAQIGDLRPFANPNLKGALFYDPFIRRDKAHADLISNLFPSVDRYRLAGCGHPASQVLGRNKFQSLIPRSLVGGPADWRAVVKKHRELRGGTPFYWKKLVPYVRNRYPEISFAP